MHVKAATTLLILSKRICVAIMAALLVVTGSTGMALDRDTPFESIYGGTLTLSQWEGQPVIVVNTASLCAFTDQYRDLQALYDRYRDEGLVVLAVPSDDFNQELASNAEVKEFCELIYGLDMPMTKITSVKGRDAHPFYQSLRKESGFTPRWNFAKVLLDGAGNVVDTFPSQISPLSDEITKQIDRVLADLAGQNPRLRANENLLPRRFSRGETKKISKGRRV